MLGHAREFEQRVNASHIGKGFDIACGGIVEEATDKRDGQAERAENGMDDDARDGANVGIDEAMTRGRVELSQVEDSFADAEVEGGMG